MTTALMDKLCELMIYFSSLFYKQQNQYRFTLTDNYRHKVMTTAHMNKLGELIIY